MQTYFAKNTLVVLHGSYGNPSLPYCVAEVLSSTDVNAVVQLYSTQNGSVWKKGRTSVTVFLADILASNFTLTVKSALREKTKHILFSHENFSL
ncbi:MAG: hypothetical protein ACRDFB_08910 [Rhabdochlamydiaceae bacterium]